MKNYIINGIIGFILLSSLYFNFCQFDLLVEKQRQINAYENVLDVALQRIHSLKGDTVKSDSITVLNFDDDGASDE